MPEGEKLRNTLLEYHTFGTDAPVWAFFSANLHPFGMIWGMIGSKEMENVIDFRKSYGIITAFPRVLGEKYDALGFLPAAAAALCGMCRLWILIERKKKVQKD